MGGARRVDPGRIGRRVRVFERSVPLAWGPRRPTGDAGVLRQVWVGQIWIRPRGLPWLFGRHKPPFARLLEASHAPERGSENAEGSVLGPAHTRRDAARRISSQR